MIEKLKRYIPLLCWMIAALALILIPFRILSYGFVPGGDARRHVAQAATERPFTETIVMRPEYTMDHSPGWAWVLRMVHRQTGWKVDGLIGFSVASLMLALFFIPLPLVRRPEAWLIAMLAMTVAIPEVLTRWIQARPFIFVEAILLAVLLAWSRSRMPSRWTMAWTCAGIALSVWLHGAWYLWALPVAAFALAGWWAAGVRFAGCAITGVAAGALLTGRPVVFLKQAWFMASMIAHQDIPRWMLVGEFQPSAGEAVTVLMLGLVYLWRRSQNKSASEMFAQPAFCLIVIGWILGFYADRFWADWGMPATIVWLALQFEDAMIGAWEATSVKRVILTGLAAAPLFLHCTSDLDRRYTQCLEESHLDGCDPALQGWMPEGDGIFYCTEMVFFFNTYYDNPEMPWRYVLGYESALMREDDWKTYCGIRMSRFPGKAYEPWVAKMRPNDRLAIYSPSEPVMPGMEWKYAGGTLWIGRKK